jgi:hypothetical protein
MTVFSKGFVTATFSTTVLVDGGIFVGDPWESVVAGQITTQIIHKAVV